MFVFMCASHLSSVVNTGDWSRVRLSRRTLLRSVAGALRVVASEDFCCESGIARSPTYSASTRPSASRAPRCSRSSGPPLRSRSRSRSGRACRSRGAGEAAGGAPGGAPGRAASAPRPPPPRRAATPHSRRARTTRSCSSCPGRRRLRSGSSSPIGIQYGTYTEYFFNRVGLRKINV